MVVGAGKHKVQKIFSSFKNKMLNGNQEDLPL